MERGLDHPFPGAAGEGNPAVALVRYSACCSRAVGIPSFSIRL